MRTHVSSVGLVIVGDPARSFIYPGHIDRNSIDALPAHPGICIFQDQAGRPAPFISAGVSAFVRAYWRI